MARRVEAYNYRLIHGLFHITLVISPIPWYWPQGFSPSDDISRGL